MRYIKRANILYRNLYIRRNCNFFSTKTVSSKGYEPNVVNRCINPVPGTLFRSTPVLAFLGGLMLIIPIAATIYDNERFKKELERRNNEGIRY